MFYIKNAKIVLEQGILWDGVLAMEGDRIAAFGPAAEMPRFWMPRVNTWAQAL